MQKKYFLIMNPGSRGGKSKKLFNTIFRYLEKRNIKYDFQITENLENAKQLSLKANKSGYQNIVAVGGDGTINNVINGFFNKDGNRISNAKMGVIYSGTSPDFCKSYHIPYKNIEQIMETLIAGITTTIQIGKISLCKTYQPDYHNKALNESVQNSELITRFFGCCVNIGLGPMLARKSNSGIRKKLGDFGGTFIALIQTLLTYKASDFLIETDGVRQEIKKMFSLSVGKTRYIASGIKVKNDLIEGDNKFYNLIVQKLELKDVARCLRNIYSGNTFKNSNTMTLEYSKQISIYGNNQSPEVEFDGDPQGYLPCQIEMAGNKLELITERNHVN